ncbi:hypothetical protein [Actinoplanes sp. OR16]|uniref:hypothetical protein n=1 Tax=Actinoplanes sp. OR16 TaxID=946334 RepID=UPI00135F1BE6|nr:hypothetical protein [Actinoplanes sp. OR16]
MEPSAGYGPAVSEPTAAAHAAAAADGVTPVSSGAETRAAPPTAVSILRRDITGRS